MKSMETNVITEYNNHNLENTENTIKIEKEESENKETIGKIENITEHFVEKTENYKSSDLFQNFSLKELFNNLEDSDNEIINKDKLINVIKKNIINRNLDFLLSNITEGNQQDLVAVDNDIIYQITTSENQRNNNYTNISNIDLGECENILKEINEINKNLSLIIFKIDYYMSGLLIPIIGYEVYHPINKSPLDLNYCKDILVKINIPVSVDEEKLFKYDPNSEYYNDECYTYTTEDRTDIILKDRQNEYIDNNLSLCENNCSYTGYHSETKKALCECETKLKIDSISEIIQNLNVLSNNFSEINSKSNINTIKCVDTLFSKDGLLTNIGCYIFLFILAIFSVSIIIFYKCGFLLIEKEIKNIIIKIKKK